MHKIKDLKPGVAVVLADGNFPKGEHARQFLRQAETIICCDGATRSLVDFGLEPSIIVGDMDSITDELKERFAHTISPSEDQETNDLTKAVYKALEWGLTEVMILGATGRREDHTIGNIGLLAEHGHKLYLQMLSDHALFTPLYGSGVFSSKSGQQVSVFNVIGQAKITTKGLRYPIRNRVLTNWWQGTLNEAEGDEFCLDFDGGVLVVSRSIK